MKKRKERKGRDLEKLVATLERVLGVEQQVKIESPKRLRDRVTGRLREFDVVITGKVGHRDLIIAVECRDRRRPVGVGEVEAFCTKSVDCGVDRRVMVSSTGFRDPAIIKATQRGIECVDLNRAEGFPWLRMKGIHYIKPKLHVHWQFNPDCPSAHREFQLVDANGKSVPQRILAENILDALGRPSPTDMPDSGILPFRFRVGGEGLYLQFSDDGSMTPVDYAIATGRLTFITEFIPFEHVSMQVAGHERPITDAALARIDLGTFDGTLVMMTDPEDGHVKIVMAAGPTKTTMERPVTYAPEGQSGGNDVGDKEEE